MTTTENNEKKTKHFFIIRAKRKKKNEDYNGVLHNNHNLHIIFKYCMVHIAVKLLING